MTKLVFASDIHLGNHKRFGGPMVCGLNDRARAVAKTMRQLARTTNEADGTFILGDVFDVDQPNPQILAEAHRVLSKLRNPFVLVGNHDQSSIVSGHHALTTIAESSAATIFEDIAFVCIKDTTTILVPPHRDVMRELSSELIKQEVKERHSRGAYRVLLGFHAGIKDESTAPWLAASPRSVDVYELADRCRELGIKWVFAGDWHERKQWSLGGIEIVQCGSLCPTGFDDVSPSHGAWIWEEGLIAFVEVPGPRFVVARSQDDLRVSARGAREIYVSWRTQPGDDVAAIAKDLEDIELAGFEVVPDPGAAREKAQEASQAARQASTLEAAVDAYCFDMALPAGVMVDGTREKALGYLRRARS